MPGLHEAWRAVRRFFARSNTPVAADTDTASANEVRWGNDLPQTMRAGSSNRLHGFYERVREQVLETQRNSALEVQEVMRKDRRAKRKALSLLMRLLNQEQRLEFRKFRYFHVVGGSSGNRYRIRIAAFANIDLLYPDGRVRHRLCAQPAGDVPVYDVMAAQLLHLQDAASEHRFLQRANVHPAMSEDHVRSGPAWIS